jgi:hypothetical protein
MAKTKKSPKTTENQNKEFRKYIWRFWQLLAVFLLAIVSVFVMASWGLFGELPTFENIRKPPRQTSQPKSFHQTVKPLASFIWMIIEHL